MNSTEPENPYAPPREDYGLEIPDKDALIGERRFPGPTTFILLSFILAIPGTTTLAAILGFSGPFVGLIAMTGPLIGSVAFRVISRGWPIDPDSPRRRRVLVWMALIALAIAVGAELLYSPSIYFMGPYRAIQLQMLIFLAAILIAGDRRRGNRRT